MAKNGKSKEDRNMSGNSKRVITPELEARSKRGRESSAEVSPDASRRSAKSLAGEKRNPVLVGGITGRGAGILSLPAFLRPGWIC